MTTATTPPAPGPGAVGPTVPLRPAALGLRRAVRDGLIVARRDVSHWIREPQMILWGLAFPVVTVLLFAFVFGSAIVVPGDGSYREFLMPGIFAQTMAFGIGETLAAVQADSSKGVTDRFRSMPIAPSAVVTGRALAGMLYSVASLGLMVGTGLLIGWQWGGSLAAALGAFALLLLLRFSFLWVGILLGLKARTAEAANSVFGLLWPLTMLSNAFIAPELMPTWLATIVEWNPLSATITATRELFGNPVGEATTWAGENAMLLAVVWPVVVTAVFLPLSVRAFQRLSR